MKQRLRDVLDPWMLRVLLLLAPHRPAWRGCHLTTAFARAEDGQYRVGLAWNDGPQPLAVEATGPIHELALFVIDLDEKRAVARKGNRHA